MSNMSYCRFENTLRDLLDCEEHITDELEGSEKEARMRMLGTCRAILETVGVDVGALPDEDALEEALKEFRE
jgi:hypothetical protein